MQEYNYARARATLMRNLPKKGFTIETDKGTGSLEDFSIVFEETEWVLSKAGAEVGRGTYGRTQMMDVKAACKKAGRELEGGPKRQMSEETKAKMAEKRKATAAKKKADKEAAAKGDDSAK